MHADQLKRFRIDWRVNPFYLRGDFDADGKPDYAVMILGERSALTGLVMCQGNGTQHILGAGSQPRFSNRRDDNFLSSDWEVVTLAEFRNLLSNKRLGGSAKEEVIVLNWEDGSGYIYWDGKAYRWFEEPAGGAH